MMISWWFMDDPGAAQTIWLCPSQWPPVVTGRNVVSLCWTTGWQLGTTMDKPIFKEGRAVSPTYPNSLICPLSTSWTLNPIRLEIISPTGINQHYEMFRPIVCSTRGMITTKSLHNQPSTNSINHQPTRIRFTNQQKSLQLDDSRHWCHMTSLMWNSPGYTGNPDTPQPECLIQRHATVEVSSLMNPTPQQSWYVQVLVVAWWFLMIDHYEQSWTTVFKILFPSINHHKNSKHHPWHRPWHPFINHWRPSASNSKQ